MSIIGNDRTNNETLLKTIIRVGDINVREEMWKIKSQIHEILDWLVN